MKTVKFFLALLIYVMPSLAFAGTAYYVDCSAASNGNGTYARPWNNIASINSHSFGLGDDVYFKAGTTCTMSAALNIDWDGTAGDSATIGCYDGNGDFDCSGARPILDGTSTIPNTDSGLIYKASGQYVTIDYLKIYRSGWMGMTIKADNVTVQNCYVSYSQRHGIFVNGDNALIDNNIVNQNGQINNPTHTANMGALVLTGQGTAITGGTINNNTIFNNYTTESLSLNRKVNKAIVENNVIYDNKSNMGIYLDAVNSVTARYNLIYNSSAVGGWNRGNGILVENEAYGYCYTGSNRVYGNLIAATSDGIAVGVSQAGCYQNDNLYYNNTIVDSTSYNFRFWPSGIGGSGNVIKDNISWTISAGSTHANNYSPSGYTWNNNNFDDLVSGNAANNARIYVPPITKKSGWRSIEPGTVNGAELGLQQSDPNNIYTAGIDSTAKISSLRAPQDLTITTTN